MLPRTPFTFTHLIQFKQKKCCLYVQKKHFIITVNFFHSFLLAVVVVGWIVFRVVMTTDNDDKPTTTTSSSSSSFCAEVVASSLALFLIVHCVFISFHFWFLSFHSFICIFIISSFAHIAQTHTHSHTPKSLMLRFLLVLLCWNHAKTNFTEFCYFCVCVSVSVRSLAFLTRGKSRQINKTFYEYQAKVAVFHF